MKKITSAERKAQVAKSSNLAKFRQQYKEIRPLRSEDKAGTAHLP
jgi:hypothetical protein